MHFYKIAELHRGIAYQQAEQRWLQARIRRGWTKLRARGELQLLPAVLDGWRNTPFFHYFDQNERDFMLEYA